MWIKTNKLKWNLIRIGSAIFSILIASIVSYELGLPTAIELIGFICTVVMLGSAAYLFMFFTLILLLGNKLSSTKPKQDGKQTKTD